MHERRQTVLIPVTGQVTRLDVDPQYDLFRLPHQQEIPPALSALFGAEKILVVLPAQAPAPLRKAYRSAITGWYGKTAAVEVVLDTAITALPADRAIWFAGWKNKQLKVLSVPWQLRRVQLAEKTVSIGSTKLPRDNHSFVLAHRSGPQALALLAAPSATALAGLARKLPHYHKYSYLAFEGIAPENVCKGRWPITSSPLTKTLVDTAVERAALLPREALASLPPRYSARAMEKTVRSLAADGLEGRGLGTTGLSLAAEMIATAFRRAGLVPIGDEKSYFQQWQAKTGSPPRLMELQNVIGALPGTEPDWQGQSIVIGAHYDHLGRGWPSPYKEHRGQIHPGADDNASGIAVLLELARICAAGPRPKRTIVFCAFTGEEDGLRGSRHYLETIRQYPANKCRAMINLDTVGRLFDNKLLVLGVGTAREWVHIFRGVGYVTGVPLDMVRDDIGSSDQASFIAKEIPAVQLFSGPHLDYHRPSDVPDKIDPAGLQKVAAVAHETLTYLASRAAPLTTKATKAMKQRDKPTGQRKSLFGTVPDFSFSGPGVRVSELVPASPAARAGIEPGDVIIGINETSVKSLRDYAAILRSLSPGATIKASIIRGKKKLSFEATLVTR